MTKNFKAKNIVLSFLLQVEIFLLTCIPVYATNVTTFFKKASDMMQSVYLEILGISTITAVVCAFIALILMNFSKNGKTVDESRAWLKRIVYISHYIFKRYFRYYIGDWRNTLCLDN